MTVQGLGIRVSDFYDGILSSADRGAAAQFPGFRSRLRQRKRLGEISRRGFDLFLAIPLLFLMLAVAIVLMLINPIFNKGPVFFFQSRMGKDCDPFLTWKFRSMSICADEGIGSRGPFDPLETTRISRLGKVLRKTRLDELPQVINVIKGDMRMIGPRPDAYGHALVFCDVVGRYRSRHAVLPGITGLAQTEVGYVAGRSGLNRKIAADSYYINNRCLSLDLWILWRTVGTVVGRRGT